MDRATTLMELWEKAHLHLIKTDGKEFGNRKERNTAEFCLNELKIAFDTKENLLQLNSKIESWVLKPDDPNDGEGFAILPSKKELEDFLAVKGTANAAHKNKGINLAGRLGFKAVNSHGENKRTIKEALKNWSKPDFGRGELDNAKEKETLKENKQDVIDWVETALQLVGTPCDKWDDVDDETALTCYADLHRQGPDIELNEEKGLPESERPTIRQALFVWLRQSDAAMEIRKKIAVVLSDPSPTREHIYEVAADAEVDLEAFKEEARILEHFREIMGPKPWRVPNSAKIEPKPEPDPTMKPGKPSPKKFNDVQTTFMSEDLMGEEEDDRDADTIFTESLQLDAEVEELETVLGKLNKRQAEIKAEIKGKEAKIKKNRRQIRKMSLFNGRPTSL